MSDATPRPWKQSGRYITATDARETIVFEVVGAIENPSVQADVDLTLQAVNARAILDAIKAEIQMEVNFPCGDGCWHGLRRALAIIEKHEKENGGE